MGSLPPVKGVSACENSWFGAKIGAGAPRIGQISRFPRFLLPKAVVNRLLRVKTPIFGQTQTEKVNFACEELGFGGVTVLRVAGACGRRRENGHTKDATLRGGPFPPPKKNRVFFIRDFTPKVVN